MKRKSSHIYHKLQPTRWAAVACVLMVSITGYAVLQFTKAATPGTINLSPTSVSTTNGQSFNVAVRLNSDQSMNAVDAHILYPASLLDVVSIDPSGSAFPNSAQQTVSSGNIQIGRYSSPNTSVTGNQLIVTILFKAKTTGSGQVTVASDSSISSDGNEIYGGSTPASITVAAAPVAPASPQATTPNQPSGGSSTSTTPNTTTPKTSTTGSTSTSTPTNPASPNTTDPNTSPTTERVDASSPKTVNEVAPVVITVLDAQNKPVAGARVTIGGQVGTTDRQGLATFHNISVGRQNVDVVANGKPTRSSISVVSQSGSSTPQKFTVKLAKSTSSDGPYNAIIATLVVAIFGAGGFLAYQTGLLSKFVGKPLPPATPTSPTSGATPPVASFEDRLSHVQVEPPKPSEVITPEKPPGPKV
jgi:hypothetical protein